MAATLSVVVPVYGTKRDLPACLESLRTQSLRDAEFLLVDDASPDGAGAVLAEYARRDSRFRVLTHSQNRGLFAARMTGADAATGKYLAFLDSDDFVSVDFYRGAVALAEENDFDLVMGAKTATASCTRFMRTVCWRTSCAAMRCGMRSSSRR